MHHIYPKDICSSSDVFNQQSDDDTMLNHTSTFVKGLYLQSICI
jgi:hypothetical protein